MCSMVLINRRSATIYNGEGARIPARPPAELMSDCRNGKQAMSNRVLTQYEASTTCYRKRYIDHIGANYQTASICFDRVFGVPLSFSRLDSSKKLKIGETIS